MSSVDPEPLYALIDDLDAHARRWAAQAEQINAALARAAGTDSTDEFTIEVTAARITRLEFTERAVSDSPVQLREAVLRSYARAAVAANRATAQAVADAGVAGVSAAVTAALPEDVRLAAGPDDADDADDVVESVSQPDETADSVPPARERYPFDLTDPTLDDEVITGSMDEIMADFVDYDTDKPTGDPSTWQAELEQQLSTIAARSEEYAAALRQVVSEQSSRTLTVTVDPGGRLVDLRFRPGWSDTDAAALTEEFRRLYAAGVADATEQALAVLGTGTGRGDDPVTRSLATVRDEARDIATGASGSDDPAAG